MIAIAFSTIIKNHGWLNIAGTSTSGEIVHSHPIYVQNNNKTNQDNNFRLVDKGNGITGREKNCYASLPLTGINYFR